MYMYIHLYSEVSKNYFLLNMDMLQIENNLIQLKALQFTEYR